MPGIKYKGTDGQWHLLNNVMVNAINVVQTSGTSTADVMSQSAVTEAVSGINEVLTAHTSDDGIHLTSTEKTNLDSLSGSVGTMAYENTSSYSSATEVNSAFSNKVDNSTFTAHTANTTHMSTTEKTNLDSLATNIGTISGITSTDKLIHETMNRRTRTNFTSKGLEWFKTTLKSAIADQSLEKYGLKVGDYVSVTHEIEGVTKMFNYVIAGLNTMRGTSTPYRLNYDHVGIIVDTNITHKWNESGNTYQSTNTYSSSGTWTTGSSAAGYANCDLHYYLTTEMLPIVEGDLGTSNLKGHSKIYSNAVNTGATSNRYGGVVNGASSGWGWYTNQKICALSEVQVYGSIVWSSSGYDTGEACRQLDVFRVYNMNEIFEGRYPWLRDVASSSHACFVSNYGQATINPASYAYFVAALILFA